MRYGLIDWVIMASIDMDASAKAMNDSKRYQVHGIKNRMAQLVANGKYHVESTGVTFD